MNPFGNDISRSQSFDLSNSASSLSSQQPRASISTVIGCDPSRLASFLGHHTFIQGTPELKLATIYENVSSTSPSASLLASSSLHWNEKKDQQTPNNVVASVRGSVSSWNL